MADSPNNLRDFADEDFQTDAITEIVVTDSPGSIFAVLKVPVGMTQILFEAKNAGGIAFDQFEIQRRPHDDAAWETVANVAGDYSSPQSPLIEVQGAPVTLGAGLTTQILMNVKATRAIQILASANGGASTGELYYRFG